MKTSPAFSLFARNQVTTLRFVSSVPTVLLNHMLPPKNQWTMITTPIVLPNIVVPNIVKSKQPMEIPDPFNKNVTFNFILEVNEMKIIHINIVLETPNQTHAVENLSTCLETCSYLIENPDLDPALSGSQSPDLENPFIYYPSLTL